MDKILIIISAVLALALILSNIIIFRYRRQIREVCRQLSFHNKNRTNQELRIDVCSKEVQQLQQEINTMFIQFNKLELQYKNSEDTLKDVVTNISHDIRTPLTSINGYFQLLCDTEDETERKKYAEIITSRIESMSMLLEQLFTYVRVQNDGLQIAMTKCDVKQTLCENLFSFYEDFKQKEINPNVKLPEESCYASLDPDLFTRVLQNILKNALVHGDEEIMVTLSCTKQKIVLDVRNHTQEVHSEDPERVFDRFYQGDRSRKSGSSGLGLCIAKKLVLKMNGTIRAYYEKSYFGIEVAFPEIDR